MILKNRVESPHELRVFGITVGLVFGAIALWPMFSHFPMRTWAALISIVLIMPALIAPLTLKFPYRLWLKIGHGLGWFNTRLILAILYLFAIFPIAVLLRITQKTPLHLRFDADANSYRENAEDDSSTNIGEQY